MTTSENTFAISSAPPPCSDSRPTQISESQTNAIRPTSNEDDIVQNKIGGPGVASLHDVHPSPNFDKEENLRVDFPKPRCGNEDSIAGTFATRSSYAVTSQESLFRKSSFSSVFFS